MRSDQKRRESTIDVHQIVTFIVFWQPTNNGQPDNNRLPHVGDEKECAKKVILKKNTFSSLDCSMLGRVQSTTLNSVAYFPAALFENKK